jgi:hypothetical protein
MAAGDWRAAREHLRRAIRQDPASVDLHYRLAVSASHLEAHDEAVQEFQWVVAHAAASTDEARVARVWLAETGSVTPARVAAAVPTSPDALRGSSTLSGVVTWIAPGGATQARQRHLLTLTGLPASPTKNARYRVRTARDGVYEFKDVIPGSYKLTDAVTGQPTWRLRVALEPARETILDLSVDNGTAVRDDFPELAARPAGPFPRTATFQSDGESGPRTSTDTTEEN